MQPKDWVEIHNPGSGFQCRSVFIVPPRSLHMLDLPRETWEAVLRNLILDHQRPLLGVNKFLRSVARRSIFQIVHIHLGAFETTHPAINDRGNASNLDRRAFIRSFEILAYILKDAAFASVVRTVVVHAYAKGRDVNDSTWRE
jgi:hypothetical protein